MLLASAGCLVAVVGWPDHLSRHGLALGLGSDVPEVAWRRAVIVAQLVLVLGLAAERFVRLALSGRPKAYVRERWVDFAMLAVALPGMAVAGGFDGRLSAGALWVVIGQLYVLFTLLLRVAGVGVRLLRGRAHPAWWLVGGVVVLCFGGAVMLMLPGAAAPNSARLWFHDALFVAVSAVTLTGLSVRPIGTEFSFFGQLVILGLIQIGGLLIMTFGLLVVRRLWRRLRDAGVLPARVEGVSPSRPAGILPACVEGVSPSCPAGILPACGEDDLASSSSQDNGTHNAGETPASRSPASRSPASRSPASLAGFVLAVAVVVELLGAALIFPMFIGQPDAQGRPLSSGGAVWYAVFHSVGAFCNSGLGLYDGSFKPFREHWQVLGVIAPLIVLGGLGLPVIRELLLRVRLLPRRLTRARRLDRPVKPWAAVKLSLHAKVVLWTTLLLLFFGTTTLLLVETIGMNIQPAEPGRNFGAAAEVKTEFQGLSAADRLRACAFLSVSSRTGGFRTCEVSHLSDAGKAVLCLLMGVGGSPGSAAGGMQTVTFAVLFVAVAAGLGRRGRPVMFGRTVAGDVVGRALTLAGLYATLVCVVSILLAVVTRSSGRFLDLFFESVSACSNAGLTTGATAGVNDPAKFILMFAMLAGRLTPMIFLRKSLTV